MARFTFSPCGVWSDSFTRDFCLIAVHMGNHWALRRMNRNSTFKILQTHTHTSTPSCSHTVALSSSHSAFWLGWNIAQEEINPCNPNNVWSNCPLFLNATSTLSSCCCEDMIEILRVDKDGVTTSVSVRYQNTFVISKRRSWGWQQWFKLYSSCCLLEFRL